MSHRSCYFRVCFVVRFGFFQCRFLWLPFRIVGCEGVPEGNKTKVCAQFRIQNVYLIYNEILTDSHKRGD